MADFSDEQKKFVDSTVEYLEANEVYDLFDTMTQELLLHQPENPIQFLVEFLSRKPAPKVILIAPPGACNLDHIARTVASRLQVGHVAAQGSVDATLQNLKSLNNNGYVLTGFPTSRVDTLKMLIEKVLPDRIIFLRESEQTLLGRLPSLAGPGEEMSSQELAIRQFFRHIVGVLQLVGPQTHQIDLDSLGSSPSAIETAAVDAIVRRVAQRGLSSGPFRPHRVVLAGPSGCGRSELAVALADLTGCVHVDVSALLRNTAQDQSDTATAKTILAATSSGDPVPDEIVCSLVEERLRAADCQSKGWVLDGFPQNEAQARHLRAARLIPSRAIGLTAAPETVRTCLSDQYTDPVTGEVFSSIGASKVAAPIQARLVQSQRSIDPQVLERRATHGQQAVAALASVFPQTSCILPLPVNLSQGPAAVSSDAAFKQTLDRIRDFVESRIPAAH